MKETKHAHVIAKLRRELYNALETHDFQAINWTKTAQETQRLAALGWDHSDIASQVLGDYGDGSPAALIVHRITQLGGRAPGSTPTPAPFAVLQAQLRAEAEAEEAAWRAQHPGGFMAAGDVVGEQR